jgi:multidrug efflux system outer membrane protein
MGGGLRSPVTLAVLLLALAGCAVGPDYSPPDPDQATGVRLAAPETQDAEAAGIVVARPVVNEWWRTLRDPKLDQLVDALVGGNLDLAVAVSRVREARALRGVSASALYPRLALEGNVGVGGSGDEFHGSLQYNVGFDAAWELDVFGGLRRGVEAAEAEVGAAIEGRRDALVSLTGELGRAYVELRGAQRQLEFARRNVALQERTLDLVRLRKKAGLASDLQVSQATSLLETTRAQVPGIETALARSVHRLSVLVGREPKALLAELDAPAPIPAIPPWVPVGLPSELLRRRPDLRRSERQLAAACAQVGVATADLYPKFTLTARIGYASTKGIDGVPSFFVGPAISWPIFAGFRYTNALQAKEAQLEQAALAYRGAVLGAFEEVENSITAYSKELVRRETLTRAAREARRATDLAQVQYRQGLVDFLNVLDAQAKLASSELALATSEQTLLVDLIAIYKALGGGWTSRESELADRELQAPDTTLPR